MPPIFEHAINAALKFLEKRIGNASKEVTTAIKEGHSVTVAATEKQTQSLNQIGTRFEKAVAKISNANFDVLVDFKPLEASLRSIAADMKKVAGKKDADMAKVEAGLDRLLVAVQENQPEKMSQSIDALDAVFSGLKPKDSVKFDDKQMKGLMAALTNGGGITTQGGTKSATDWQVDVVTITSADTEYEYVFPSSTVSWTLKLRGSSGVLYYSHETGKLPVSGNNTNYLTLPASGTRSQDNVEWGGKKMFLESDSSGQTLEIEVFTM
jgi:cell division protein ZapA (FtsZ GTPase activity inhibitor)